MKRKEVEKILKFYNEIDMDIKMCKGMIQEYNEMYNPLGAVVYDGIPKGTRKSDSTANLAIKISDLDKEVIREHIEELEQRINKLYKLRTEILKELTALRVVHKVIIMQFYIKGKNWERIAEQINYSVRQSQNYRNEALQELGNKIALNKYITQDELIKNYIA